MVTSAERLRLESAYATPADARPVLRACAFGLLAVLLIAVAAAVMGSDPDTDQVAGVSAPRAATGR
jgi:hypothetical protein